MKNSLLSECNVMYVDHLAVTTPVFEQTLGDFLYLEGSRLLKGPAVNPVQKVRYAFVRLREGLTVEILAPEADSPIARHVQQKGGPYHFCYAVADMALALDSAQRGGAKLIVTPTADVAFDSRKVAFLFHEAHGVFELVEAYPGGTGECLLNRQIDRPEGWSQAAKPLDVERTHDEIEKRLQQIFLKVLPKIEVRDLPTATMNDALEWDSLAQIHLVMELEAAFSCNIPPVQIEKLTSYQAISSYLRQEAP